MCSPSSEREEKEKTRRRELPSRWSNSNLLGEAPPSPGKTNGDLEMWKNLSRTVGPNRRQEGRKETKRWRFRGNVLMGSGARQRSKEVLE